MTRLGVVVLAIAITSLTAAPVDSASLGLRGLLAIPIGDFGNDSPEDDDAGLAKTGYGAGVVVDFPLGAPNLTWLISGSLIVNPFAEDAMRDVVGVNVEAASWINVPILTGVRYEVPSSPQVKVYLTGLAGLNIVRCPDTEWSAVVYDGGVPHQLRAKQGRDSGTSFGFEVGGGFLVGGGFDVSLRYLNLGKPEFDVTMEVTVDDETESTHMELEQSISILVLSLGVAF